MDKQKIKGCPAALMRKTNVSISAKASVNPLFFLFVERSIALNELSRPARQYDEMRHAYASSTPICMQPCQTILYACHAFDSLTRRRQDDSRHSGGNAACLIDTV